jgi:hypothetical protein
MTDWNFPHPLRLAAGSHQAGSGKGCAMNVVSYENGDKKITDFPPCSARPLSRIVQVLNDSLSGKDGFLSPTDSITVLDIAHQTMGTADYTRRQMNLWLADLLVDETWGVVQYAGKGADVVRHVAELLRTERDVTREEWRAERSAAYAAYAAPYAATNAAYAAYAATNAAAYVDAALPGFAAWAVQRFRDHLGLDAPVVPAERVQSAVASMGGVR